MLDSYRLAALRIAACGFGLLATAALHAEPPKLNYLYPAGAARGATVTVTASGTFAEWPVKAWVDRAGLDIKAGEKKGELSVTVHADAECGGYLVRLYDSQGATSVRPFLVGTLAELLEQEPNDEAEKAQRLESSATINGKLNRGGDVDQYALHVNQGQTLVASLRGNSLLASPMDAVLQICTADGFVLEQNDDERGIDPQIAFRAPRDGDYLVRAFAFPATPNSSIAFAGGDTYIYRLAVTTGGFLDHAFPLAVSRDQSMEVRLFGWNIPAEDELLTVGPTTGDVIGLFRPQLAESLRLPVLPHACVVAVDDSSPQQPQAVTVPVTITGRIEGPRDVDAFRLTASKGQRLRLVVQSRDLGYPLDPVLRVLDSGGKVVAEIDDVSGKRDAELAFTAAADGDYTVEIHDLHHAGGFRYVYRLSVQQEVADFALQLAADTFLLTPGKPLEVPVTVQRNAGFKEEITITAVGLPAGVKADAVQSLPKGDTSKAVKLKLSADAAFPAGTIRILGQSPADKPLQRTAGFPVPGWPSPLVEVWLSSAGNKSS